MTTPIPDKLYFRIGEVAEIVGVKPHVLRYWEEEFPTLRPAKSRAQQRLYQRREIELLLRLKELLYDRGYTISGARKLLRSHGCLPQDDAEIDAKQMLSELREELQALRQRLDAPPGTSGEPSI